MGTDCTYRLAGCWDQPGEAREPPNRWGAEARKDYPCLKGPSLIRISQRKVRKSVRLGPLPDGQEPRHLRLPGDPVGEQKVVTSLARCEYVERRENIIAIGNSGKGKTHMGLGLAACQRGLSVGFTTAAALVNELMEARDERRLLNFQKCLSRLKLLIIDELGFVSLSKTGAELLFEVFSQRYERGSVLVTTNLRSTSGRRCSARNG